MHKISRCWTKALRSIHRGLLPGIFLIAVIIAGAVVSAGEPVKGPTVGVEFRRLMLDGDRSNSLGRYQAAERSFRAALAQCEERNGTDTPACINVLIRLGLDISNQQRFEEADLIFQRAGVVVRNSTSPFDLPRYLTYSAMNFANRGDFKTAFVRAHDANQRRKELIRTEFAAAKTADSSGKRRLDMALTDLAHGLFIQATIAYRLGRNEEARVTAHLARRLITKTNGAPGWWVAVVDELLADIDLREGKPEAAEKRLKLALKTKQLAFGNTRAVALSHLSLGAVYQDVDRNSDALRTSRPGLAIVHAELGEAPGVDFERLVPFLTAAHSESARDASRRDALYAEMFGASQLVRSGATARTIAQVAARFSHQNPDVAGLVRLSQEAVQERDRIRLELGRLAVSVKARADNDRINELRVAYAKAVKNATALERNLASVFPEYSRFVTSPPVSAAQLGDLLRPDEALVRFIIGEKKGFVFLSRRGRLQVAPLNITREQVRDAVRRIREPFEQAGARIAAFDTAASHALFRVLFGPIEAQLAGTRHLITVSSGALMSLPFALLVTDAPDGIGANDYGRAAWLTRKMAVSQMPSVRAFADLRGTVKASNAPLPFIGFGDPSFTGAAGDGGIAALAQHCQVGEPMPPAMVRRLTALPETSDELRQVARVLGAGADSIHLAEDASEHRLRQLSLDRYRVVYFATHGLLPGDLRCQSEPALALSPPAAPAADRSGDGMLDASEIAGLRLDADLVVLSACNTGGGGSAQFGGESLSGLARAFFQAGARSMIVSHWQVDSKATARLMTGIFAQLGAGRGTDTVEALRLAQLKMISNAETAHPFFWAAFAYVGAGVSTSTSLPESR